MNAVYKKIFWNLLQCALPMLTSCLYIMQIWLRLQVLSFAFLIGIQSVENGLCNHNHCILPNIWYILFRATTTIVGFSSTKKNMYHNSQITFANIHPAQLWQREKLIHYVNYLHLISIATICSVVDISWCN